VAAVGGMSALGLTLFVYGILEAVRHRSSERLAIPTAAGSDEPVSEVVLPR